MQSKKEKIERAEVKKLNSTGAGKFEYIKPFFPSDFPVIKMTEESGNVKYYSHFPKDELRVCNTELEMEILVLLEPLEIIEQALAYNGQNSFANTLTAIRQSIESSIQEIFRFVNNISEIQIISIRELKPSSPYRWGQCVNAELLPPDKIAEKPTFDIDPELIESLEQIPPDKTETIKDIARYIVQGRTISYQASHR